MSDVTHLLDAAAAGDRRAAADLLPLVYDELRKLAAVRTARIVAFRIGQRVPSFAMTKSRRACTTAGFRIFRWPGLPSLSEGGPHLFRVSKGT
jgi:hypothetical protein